MTCTSAWMFRKWTNAIAVSISKVVTSPNPPSLETVWTAGQVCSTRLANSGFPMGSSPTLILSTALWR